jgi:hypothetical protein
LRERLTLIDRRQVDPRPSKQIGTHHRCPQPLKEDLIRVVDTGVPDAAQGLVQ